MINLLAYIHPKKMHNVKPDKIYGNRLKDQAQQLKHIPSFKSFFDDSGFKIFLHAICGIPAYLLRKLLSERCFLLHLFPFP